MEQNRTGSSNPTPSRGNGAATSAMMRDATRLRSVMGRPDAGENEQAGRDNASALREHDSDRLIPGPAGMNLQHGADIDRDIAMPELGDRSIPQTSNSSRYEAPRMEETATGASQPRPTMLRTPAAVDRRSHADAPATESGDGATVLRPVAALQQERERNRSNAMRGHYPVEPPNEESGRGASSEQGRKGYGEPRSIGPEPARYRAPAARQGRGRGVLMAVTMLAGTAIGIGLYAGGGDLLSEMFANKNEGVTFDNPSAVTERPQPPAPVPVEQNIPLADSAASSAPAVAAIDTTPVETHAPAGVKPSTPINNKSTVVDNMGISAKRKVDAPDKAPTPAVTPVAARSTKIADAAKPVKNVGEKNKELAKATAKVKETSTAAGNYIVQVRATSDEAEANRIARKLRSKGMKDVTVVLSEKNGVAQYRVRHRGSYGSASEAQAAVQRAGFSDPWVIKQK